MYSDEMRGFLWWRINHETCGQDELMQVSSFVLGDLLKEIDKQTEQAKNPKVTVLWGKPMGYWIELEKSISSWEYPSGLAWHNWQLKMENEELKKVFTVLEPWQQWTQTIIFRQIQRENEELKEQMKVLKLSLQHLAGGIDAKS